MDQALVRRLRARGIDVVTAQDVETIERSDADHLAYAAQTGRVLFTFNVGDFWGLHSQALAEGGKHAGIILVVQQRYSVGELLRRLLRLAATLSEYDMVNRAEFLRAWEPLS